ncbi:MAG: VOC family protein, partial [Actinomycetota bacterium]
AAADLAAMTSWPIERFGHGEDPLVAGRAVSASARASGPNGWIELVQVDGDPSPRRGVNEPGVTHAAIQVGEIDDVVARLDAAGIDRHPGPVELGTGFRYLYVRDVEQLVTEVEGAPHAPADLEPWLGHGAIATPDIDHLRSAYEGFLGASATNTVRVRNHPVFDLGAALDDVDVTATWVPTTNAPVEMWQYHSPATGANPAVAFEHPGAGHLAFETDDVDADLQRADVAGFETRDEVAENDGVQVARIVDPDGNWVELIRFTDTSDPRSLRSTPDLRRVARMNALLRGGEA